MKSKYIPQEEILARAARDGAGATLRLLNVQLLGEDKLGLSWRQITHIEKKLAGGKGAMLKFSKTQLKRMTKMGGILPLLILLTMILGGISAAGHSLVVQRTLQKQSMTKKLVSRPRRKPYGTTARLKHS